MSSDLVGRLLTRSAPVLPVPELKGVLAITIKLKRVYEPWSRDDGYRVLVDRLWPRGLSEETAHVELWLRRVAPSTGLRQWYGHDVARWPEFQTRYREELSTHGELLDLILDIERHRKVVTLLFGAKDESHNEANVLLEVLRERSDRSHIHREAE